MYCPNCATPASTAQRFCRSCGVSLQPHAQILVGQSPSAEPGQGQVEGVERLQRRRRKLERWIVTVMGGGLLAVMLTVAYKLVTETILKGEVMFGVFLLAILGAFIIGIALAIYAAVLPKASPKDHSPQPTPLSQ